MDEESITAITDDQATDPNATDQQTDTTVDNLDTSTSTDTTDTTSVVDATKDDAPAPTFDDDLDDWASKRKLSKAETDEQRQALQDLRNEQREFTRTQQAKKDSDALKSAIDDSKPGTEDDDDDFEDPMEKRLREVEADRANEKTIRLQSEFYSAEKVTTDEHKALLDIMKEKFTRPATAAAKQTAFDIWSSPDALPDLLDLARARIANSVDTSAEIAAAEQATRERIAQESNATSTNRGAKDTTTQEKSPEQDRLDRFSTW